MPTVLLIRGWRLFFYSDEGNEPLHIHAQKAECECKFWLNPDVYEVDEVWSYHLTLRLRREVRKIIFDHLDLIVEAWNTHFKGHDHADN